MSLFPTLGVSGAFFIFILFLLESLYANSVDPNRTLRAAASDLGLHCLPRSEKRDAKPKWVNQPLPHAMW